MSDGCADALMAAVAVALAVAVAMATAWMFGM